MKRGKENHGVLSVDDLANSLENVLEHIQNFSPGDSIYCTMKNTKRTRSKQDTPISPETISPPKKTGRTSRIGKSQPRLKVKGKTKEPGESTPIKSRSRSKPTPLTQPEPGSSLVSTPATSYSSIPISVTSESEIPEEDEPLDDTVIPIIPLEDQPMHNPLPVLSSSHKYTVELGMIHYITGTSPIKPKEFAQTLRLWYQDLWNNLENPPDILTSSMFLVAIPATVSNQKKINLMMTASSNLEMARLYKQFIQRDKTLFTKDFKEWLPFESVQEAKELISDEPPILKMHDQFITVTKELLDTVRVLQKDIDRNAFLFRSVCVDTAQGLREGGERMIKEVKAITGIVATATTPISTPTRDKATTMPPPSRAPPVSHRKPYKPSGPVSITIKPKK